MSRSKTEIRLAAVGKLIAERVGQKRRAGPNGWCYVPWRYLDELADAVRATGITVDAPNLGADAYIRSKENADRRHERIDSTTRLARAMVEATKEGER